MRKPKLWAIAVGVVIGALLGVVLPIPRIVRSASPTPAPVSCKCGHQRQAAMEQVVPTRIAVLLGATG